MERQSFSVGDKGSTLSSHLFEEGQDLFQSSFRSMRLATLSTVREKAKGMLVSPGCLGRERNGKKLTSDLALLQPQLARPALVAKAQDVLGQPDGVRLVGFTLISRVSIRVQSPTASPLRLPVLPPIVKLL